MYKQFKTLWNWYFKWLNFFLTLNKFEINIIINFVIILWVVIFWHHFQIRWHYHRIQWRYSSTILTLANQIRKENCKKFCYLTMLVILTILTISLLYYNIQILEYYWVDQAFSISASMIWNERHLTLIIVEIESKESKISS